MFFREFTLLKVRRPAGARWEFPLSLDECHETPLAGSFDEGQLAALDRAIGHLPFARRTRDGRRAWRIATRRGELDVWLTSDGSVFVEGVTTLNLVYALLLQALEVHRDLAVEDRITGELHDRASLLGLVRREEQRAARRAGALADAAA